MEETVSELVVCKIVGYKIAYVRINCLIVPHKLIES